MKKLAIYFLFLALSTLLMAVAPVFAEPAQKIPVTAVTFGGSNTLTEERETNGGIVHNEAIRTGNILLTIEGQSPITGSYSEVVHITVNTKTGKIVIQNFDVLTFPGGSFEGVKQLRSTPPSAEQHAIFQGSGIFEGQTLMLSQEVPPVPPTYTGFLLIH